jgi:hypothetical protein
MPFMNAASNDSNARPNVAPSNPAKKSYEAPAVKVYGDVRDLTGSGPRSGVNDMSMSSPSFS